MLFTTYKEKAEANKTRTDIAFISIDKRVKGFPLYEQFIPEEYPSESTNSFYYKKNYIEKYLKRNAKMYLKEIYNLVPDEFKNRLEKTKGVWYESPNLHVMLVGKEKPTDFNIRGIVAEHLLKSDILIAEWITKEEEILTKEELRLFGKSDGKLFFEGEFAVPIIIRRNSSDFTSNPASKTSAVSSNSFANTNSTYSKPKQKQTHLSSIPIGDERFCPKCGSQLVLRSGAYGNFYGCSSYPRCRHTAKI